MIILEPKKFTCTCGKVWDYPIWVDFYKNLKLPVTFTCNCKKQTIFLGGAL